MISIFLLLFPIGASLRTFWIAFQWAKRGVAGIEEYEYRKSENKTWYFISIFGLILMGLIFLGLGVFFYTASKVTGGKISPFINLIFFPVLVLQSLGLGFKPRGSA